MLSILIILPSYEIITFIKIVILKKLREMQRLKVKI